MVGLIARLVELLIALVEERLQTLARDVQAEVRRVALVVVWTFVAFVFGTLAMLLLAATVIIAFWEEHRLLAATAVTTGFLAVTAIAVFQVRKRLAQRRISGG
ncbi:MAG: phage holin family protein [Steroidobacteraceae bacterium]